MDINYNWSLKDSVFLKNKGKVFSCFSCGGGSTMGYKLSGFDVIGNNDIDKRMNDVYQINHKPKYSFLESITTFSKRNNLPKELYELDILDGSPPCSSFSMSGRREKDWGKNKVFREGQESQVLDTLFFDFIYLAKKLKPKIVVAENVRGLLFGNAAMYVKKIYEQLDEAGYYLQHFLLNASEMGVPQKRERVFFIAIRKDLTINFLEKKDIFSNFPKLDFIFNEKKIPFLEIMEVNALPECKMYPSIKKHWLNTSIGESFTKSYFNETGKRGWFNYEKIDPTKVLNTITAHIDGGGQYHHLECRGLSRLELIKAGSFPIDYDFLDLNAKYLIGMSVPPVMMAKIANVIYDELLSKLN